MVVARYGFICTTSASVTQVMAAL